VCYHAAIVVLNDPLLPDRLALTAHALRELMEKLPNNGVVDTGADLNTKVNELRPPWENAVREEADRGGDQWGNGIGEMLRSFLNDLGEFFRGRDGIVAGRREQTVQFLNQLDPAAIPLPEDVQRRNAQEWMRLRQYFNGVSHHQFAPADQDFQERVRSLESFLSARLLLRPTDDFATIDALLAEENP
jgi:hypothetical protein